MKLAWKDAYKIGCPEIDAQHKEIFIHARAFLDAQGKAALTAGAMTLYQYTRKHFSHEEALMREVGYPSIAAHTEQHNHLISRLNIVAKSIASDTLEKSDLEAFLAFWLLNHIGGEDVKLAKYIELAQVPA